MDDLKGKKILLIAPRFFGYEVEIKRCLENRGATVAWLRDRPFDRPWHLAVLRIFPRLMLIWANYFCERRIEQLPISRFDIIFAVNTVTLTPKIMEKIRKLNSRAKYIIYMWDSMENRVHVKHILKYFDFKWCFDPETAKCHGMNFRPLFFLNEYKSKSSASEIYDLSFVGSVHADRYAVIDKLRKLIPNQLRCFFYLYLRAGWIFWLQKIIKPSMWQARYNEFAFRSISKSRVIEIVNQSKAILDIEHPKQRGLTMRTFEALGAGKKLITTNYRIRDYDFFHSDNIAVIDRLNPVVPEYFWATPYRSISAKLYDKYSIDGWLNEVLGLREI